MLPAGRSVASAAVRASGLGPFGTRLQGGNDRFAAQIKIIDNTIDNAVEKGILDGCRGDRKAYVGRFLQTGTGGSV
jgi:hypothetical protein